MGKHTGATSILVLAFLARTAGADGNIRIHNRIDTIAQNNYLWVTHSSMDGILEGLDNYDGPIPSFVAGRSGVYALIEGTYCKNDWRPDVNNSPFSLNLYHNGTTTEPLGNHLELLLDPNNTGNTFDGKPITLQQADASWNRFGPIYDVRDIVANHGGILDLPPLPPGSYSPYAPYAYYVLDFQPVPEPSTFVLLGMGAVGLLALAWRRRKA